jgi:hypothetical protein
MLSRTTAGELLVRKGYSMKRLWASILLIPFITFLGCENKSPPGGPGAHKGSDTGPRTSAHAGSSEVAKTDGTFSIKGPAISMAVKQGEKKEVDLTISRDKNFKQDVKLKYEAPKGLKIEGPADIKPSQDGAKLMVEATKDAALGDNTVEVIATPETGKQTTMSFKITVK